MFKGVGIGMKGYNSSEGQIWLQLVRGAQVSL